MIGNDIVDLAFAAQTSDWQRPSWLNKLFTTAERDFIERQHNPEQFVWLFWSMKESAYKVIVQQEQERFFAPKKLECTLLSQTTQSSLGRVNYQSKYFLTRSIWNDQYIHSLASTPDQFSSAVSEVFLRPADPSPRWMYQKVTDRFSREAKFPAVAGPSARRALRIKKNNLGIPQLFCGHTQQSFPFSISHHGRYGAFAIVES